MLFLNANYLIIFSSIFIRDAFSSLDNMIYQKLLYRGTLRNAIRRLLLQILIIVVIFGINAIKLIGSENDLFIGNNSKFALNQTMSLNHNSDIFWQTPWEIIVSGYYGDGAEALCGIRIAQVVRK